VTKFALSLIAPFAAFALAGCFPTVDYGDVRHSAYVEKPRCAPRPGAPVDAAALPLFFVTSRLPDCREPEIRLLAHRGERVRYGRFAEPRDERVGGKTRFRTPLALQEEGDWWRALQAETGRKQGRVLLYVHGYRESFETTTKDAAQIARMTGFDGPVVAYSWPSQHKVLSYAVDETNMYHDVRNFRIFLKALAEQPWVTEVVIVAHSLGARLVVPAIAYVDRAAAGSDSRNISNIILASPDIDRETFERDISADVLAAAKVARARRITAYVSLRDKALAASRAIHGYPRLGSPYCFDTFAAKDLEKQGLPVRCYADRVPGLTIVDTTDVSRGSTGHSNFLRSAVVCRDFVDVVAGRLTRSERVPVPLLSHVFRLLPDPAAPKDMDDIICQRNDDSEAP